jgi:hypothetical protein
LLEHWRESRLSTRDFAAGRVCGFVTSQIGAGDSSVEGNQIFILFADKKTSESTFHTTYQYQQSLNSRFGERPYCKRISTSAWGRESEFLVERLLFKNLTPSTELHPVFVLQLTIRVISGEASHMCLTFGIGPSARVSAYLHTLHSTAVLLGSRTLGSGTGLFRNCKDCSHSPCARNAHQTPMY